MGKHGGGGDVPGFRDGTHIVYDGGGETRAPAPTTDDPK